MRHTRLLKALITWTLWSLFLAGLQTTVWPLLFGNVGAPQLWLNVVLFFILFRQMMPALFTSYLLVLLWRPFTSLSVGVFWTSFLMLVPVGSMIKSRAFWPGVRYFMIGSFCLTFGWHVTSFVVSQFLESNPADLHLLTRLTEILLTPLAAVPQFHLMRAIDRWVNADPAAEFEGIQE